MQPAAWVPCAGKAAWGPVRSLSCRVTGPGGNRGSAWPGLYSPTCRMGRMRWGRGRSLRRRAASAVPVSSAAATWGHVCSFCRPGPRDPPAVITSREPGVRRPGGSLLLPRGAGLEQEPRGLRTPQLAWGPLLDHEGDKSCPTK